MFSDCIISTIPTTATTAISANMHSAMCFCSIFLKPFYFLVDCTSWYSGGLYPVGYSVCDLGCCRRIGYWKGSVGSRFWDVYPGRVYAFRGDICCCIGLTNTGLFAKRFDLTISPVFSDCIISTIPTTATITSNTSMYKAACL